ncbi:DUF1294 domain-containing protein [Acidovorax radicis]|jgi:uncharacterized membrane protein YsdA (DUF1294 family)/cold shock CspA family protein|uniref:DUF1294 domain-containing protein n=1 Tax=Acidovorax radicis TaxID=758826 RepID=UPI001CF879C9|nr:cold shock and DUF1294 domain-containing protein [Acidovorax radicis]UCU97456.1 cold shock and DUF1294 domain-containing protein [Acidovorax radicis]
MQKQGTVIRWDVTRAFGFIRSPGTPADVFFHIRDFQGAAAPSEGLTVVYEEIHVGGKGPRAMAVQPTGPQGVVPSHRPAPTSAQRARPASAQAQKPSQPPSGRRPAKTGARSASAGPAWLLMLGWLALLAWGLRSGRLAPWVLGAAVAINLITFLAYAMDKSAAQNGQWRTKESHLHLLSLAGGWPGAWCAQQWLRHKSSKVEFRAVYWVTVVLHCGALLAWVAGWIAGWIR